MSRLGKTALALSAPALITLGLASCTPDDAPSSAPASGPRVADAGTDGSIATGPQLPPLFAGAVARAPALPIAGGTLIVSGDGTTAVAADPDRDQVFLVDLGTHAVRSVELAAKDEPGRVVEGPSGVAYVALRNAGALVKIDVAAGSVAQRVPVCGAPRGLAYDAASGSVYVACRSGRLLTLDAASLAVTRTLQLDADLRDVIVRARQLVVTRFASAEVLLVDSDGSVLRRAIPQLPSGCSDASVLYRALAHPSGSFLLAHESSANTLVNTSQGGYGASCSGGALVSRLLTVADVDHAQPSAEGGVDPRTQPAPGSMTFSSLALAAVGPLDIAFDADGSHVAVLATGETWPYLANDTFGVTGTNATLHATLRTATWANLSAPSATLRSIDDVAAPRFLSGEPVAIAFDPSGKLVAQSREPATLELESGELIPLSSVSHADTGLAMFHMNSGVGMSCSSCHPEGNEDGHVWHFAEGLRRTQPLLGGVLERAPFHWDGALPTLPALVTEVLLGRMDLQAQPSPDQVAELGTFLDSFRAPAGADGLDSAAVARGSALFHNPDIGCDGCHAGPQYTDNKLEDVGTGGAFQTPSLLGVGLRAPLMHDGCAATLQDRFGICGGSLHGHPELLSDAQLQDLITFLQSL